MLIDIFARRYPSWLDSLGSYGEIDVVNSLLYVTVLALAALSNSYHCEINHLRRGWGSHLLVSVAAVGLLVSIAIIAIVAWSSARA
ncbi:MAG: hypothetical protein K2Z25_23200 [Beijerinckiaceae bacterium]|nr:hypothetical protein [Beijerinckiaceae bacterium]